MAIGAAIAALATSVIAVIVVATREPAAAAVTETAVGAADIAKLDKRVVEVVVRDGKPIGVKIVDAPLRESLGLASDDVITAIAGRAITRDGDAATVMRGATAHEASRIYVDVLRDGAPIVVRWRLAGEVAAKPSKDDSGGVNPLLGDPLFATITKLDDYRYEVPRSTIERIIANPDDHVKTVRIVPAIKNGMPEGFKLYAIRPNSLWTALGLQNGDVIRAINGVALTSIDKALEVYTRLRDAKELAVDLTRRGKYELITLTIK